MNKPRKYCASYPCNRIALPGSAYCAEHQKKPAPKAADPFYHTPRWRKFRAWYLANHPFCEQCEEEGRFIPADMVDHVCEIRDGGGLTDEANARALCWKCHGIKTQQAKNHRKSDGNNRLASKTRS